MDALSIRRIFHAILGLTYIGLGVFMLIKKVIPGPVWGWVLSAAFILYGSWRIYRSTMIK